MSKKLTPLGARVLLRRLDSEEKTTGGIIIPDTAKEKPQEAEVVSIGTGGKDEDGNEITFSVKDGDRVLISKYAGTEVKIDGQEFLVLKESEILAIIVK